MNKYVLIILIIQIFLTGCNNINKGEELLINKENNDIAISEKDGKAQPGINNKQGAKYISDKFGFTIDIPAEWVGSYRVDEFEEGVNFVFIGESQVSKQGVDMFTITTLSNEEEEEYNKTGYVRFCDSVIKVGVVEEKNYYYCTGTDAPSGIFEAMGIEISEAEEILMKNDLKKYLEMVEEQYNVATTFKELIK